MSVYLNTLSVAEQQLHYTIMSNMEPHEVDLYVKMIDSQYQKQQADETRSQALKNAQAEAKLLRARLYQAVVKLHSEVPSQKEFACARTIQPTDSMTSETTIANENCDSETDDSCSVYSDTTYVSSPDTRPIFIINSPNEYYKVIEDLIPKSMSNTDTSIDQEPAISGEQNNNQALYTKTETDTIKRGKHLKTKVKGFFKMIKPSSKTNQ